MPKGRYICEVCERDGKAPGEKCSVPADEIGVELMKAHLRDEHGIKI